MIIARIDEDKFLDLVRKAPTIAFQRLEYGYAVAASGEAYYAPVTHPGGGNLSSEFVRSLEHYSLARITNPQLRSLRPTMRPAPSHALVEYLRAAFFASELEPMSVYSKADGSHPAVIESECQVVIQAIEEHERPELKSSTESLMRDAMSDALDLVIDHATGARELAEVGDYKPQTLKLHLLQASQAMKHALSLLLKP